MYYFGFKDVRHWTWYRETEAEYLAKKCGGRRRSILSRRFKRFKKEKMPFSMQGPAHLTGM